MDKLEKFDNTIKELEESLNSIKNLKELTDTLVKVQELNKKLLDKSSQNNNIVSLKLDNLESAKNSLLQITTKLDETNNEKLTNISNILEKELSQFFTENKKQYRDLDSIIDTRISKLELNLSTIINDVIVKENNSQTKSFLEELERYESTIFMQKLIFIGVIFTLISIQFDIPSFVIKLLNMI
jgi:hypothetical protein